MKYLFMLLGWLSVSVLVEAGQPFNRVIIDPGHGGYDWGASRGAVQEKELALDVARRVETILRKRGISTRMTREDDTYLSLPERTDVANSNKNAIFVSIHFNSTEEARVTGLETFYASPTSRELAERVQRHVLAKVRTKSRGTRKARYYVLMKSDMPAVLVECGFLTNSWERGRALKSWYRQLIAEGIAKGILNYRYAQKTGKAD